MFKNTIEGRKRSNLCLSRTVLIIFPIFIFIVSCDKSLNPKIDDYCLYFDGQDDKVIAKDNNDAMDNISQGITLEAWINLKSLEGLVGRIIDRSDNQLDDRYVIEVYNQGNEPIVHLNINRNSLWSKSIRFNTWVHIAGTYDGKDMRLFINGILRDSLTVETKIDVNESDILIGHGGPNSGHAGAFHGYLNELSIWQHARTAQQIKRDMDGNILVSQHGLVCYWQVQSGSGQWILDSKRNANGQLGSTLEVDDDDPTWILKQN